MIIEVVTTDGDWSERLSIGPLKCRDNELDVIDIRIQRLRQGELNEPPPPPQGNLQMAVNGGSLRMGTRTSHDKTFTH